MSAACRSCGEPIRWTKTQAGKAMPLNAEPTPDGNVDVRGPTGYVLGPLEVDAHEGPLYLSHFATCPQAASHRRRA